MGGALVVVVVVVGGALVVVVVVVGGALVVVVVVVGGALVVVVVVVGGALVVVVVVVGSALVVVVVVRLGRRRLLTALGAFSVYLGGSTDYLCKSLSAVPSWAFWERRIVISTLVSRGARHVQIVTLFFCPLSGQRAGSCLPSAVVAKSFSARRRYGAGDRAPTRRSPDGLGVF